nr:cellulase family glycosylhydrolase [uncultured Acetatifactor sp.]
MKKSVKLVSAAVLSMVLCWFVGQQLKGLNEPMQQSVQETESEMPKEENDSFGILEFEGAQDTEDNPWQQTAGLFEMEEMGECIFLTPNTAVTILETGSRQNITLQYSIHPWMRENSDGAGLLVWVLDEEDNILYQEEWSVSSTEDWQEQTLSLGDYANSCKVKISCNNGSGDNDNGDWVVIRCVNENSVSNVFGSGGYVKSATYFAEEWPINFWNSEMDNLESDMAQIKEDGFNSIIIVIPWREFQPEINPIQYNNNAFAALDKVMKAAEKQDLDVYVRIGYTWDFFNDQNQNIADRFYGLLYDEQIKEAWCAYVAKMYECLSQYDNFAEGFITWEDFWNNLAICDEPDTSRRLEYAQQIGYGKWVRESYSLEEYNTQYGTQYNSYEEIAIPHRDEPAMYAMYEYYDDFLLSLLAESQEIFPNLSMEVRLDWDVTYNNAGTVEYYNHMDTFACGDSSFTSTMYGIPMGFENVGEKVSYLEGLQKTEYILSQLQQQNENKPVYVEQFIFADNTPAYKNNAQIKEDETDDYLENVSDILLEYTSGYGIWTYKNYEANMIYNPQFALQDDGWKCEGDVQFSVYEESVVCELGENGAISQEIPDVRNHFDSDEYILSISIANVVQEGKLQIAVGNEMLVLDINESGNIELTFNKNDSFNIQIKSVDGKMYVDNIKLYSQIQNGFLYDEDGNELSCIKSLRILNSQLEE